MNEPHAELTHEQIERYSRHLLLPEVGLKGQQQLKSASVLIVGAGGLGSPAALYLAGAGVGNIGIVDPDTVSVSNLQRQILHGTAAVGLPKTQSAHARLHDFNPDILVSSYNEAFTSDSAERISQGYDLIIDGTDNFPTRYLINDVCLRLGIPFIYGGVFRMSGQASVFCVDEAPCYRCLFPAPPLPESVLTCSEAGVLGVVPGMIGTVQATEAIKVILKLGTPLLGRLLTYDASNMAFETITIEKNPRCPTCSLPAEEVSLVDYEGFCGVPGTGSSVPVLAGEAEISPTELKAKLETEEAFRLIDVRLPEEWDIVHIEGSELIPIRELTNRLDEFEPTESIVLVCRSGIRSARGVALLQEHGISHAEHLAGGLLAWIEEIDPSLPVY